MILNIVLFTSLGLAVLGIALAVGGAFNQMVRTSREIDRAFANVEVSLRQRHDELPRLVEVCRAHAAHESEVLQRVTELRRQFDDVERVDDKVSTENLLMPDVRRLLALGEAYPQLHADASFLRLQNRLSELEDVIADRRELFNAATTAHNTFLSSFPGRPLARLLGFSERPLLEARVVDREPPRIAGSTMA